METQEGAQQPECTVQVGPPKRSDNYYAKFYEVYCRGNDGTVTLESLREKYDYVEVYDPEKPYGKEPFSASFSQGKTRLYTYQLWSYGSRRYVVVCRKFTEEQIKSLAPYCPCWICALPWYSPVKWLACKECNGCLWAGLEYAREPDIKAALQRVRESIQPLQELIDA